MSCSLLANIVVGGIGYYNVSVHNNTITMKYEALDSLLRQVPDVYLLTGLQQVDDSVNCI